jgi:hypothetical protein
MSIVSSVDAKLVTQVREVAPADAVAPVGVSSSIVNQLVQWIPAEAITLYLGYVALLDPLAPHEGGKVCDLSFRGRWIGLAVFCIVTILLVIGSYWGKRHRATPVPKFKWPLFEMVIQTFAFAVWAAALPDTPFADVCGFKPEYAGYAVLVTTVLTAFIAWMVGKAPDVVKG